MRHETMDSAKRVASTARHQVFKTEATQASIVAIQGREFDTRATTFKPVCKLAASIREVGIIHPIVIDRQGTLLAGGHRRAAIHYLRKRHSDSYRQWFPNGMIPVRVLDVDAEPTKRPALEIEISENEKRRDYTAKDVPQLVNRLKEAGYSTRLGGPSAGKRHITGALATIIGKSERTVRRMLGSTTKEPGDALDKSIRSLDLALRRSLDVIEESGSSNESAAKLRKWLMRGIPLDEACMPQADGKAANKVA